MIEREDIDRVTGKAREAAQRVEDKVRDTDEYRKLRSLPQKTQKWITAGAVLVLLLILAQCAMSV